MGQTAWEEIDLQPAGDPGGENYGWDCREGAHPYTDTNGDQNATCPASGFVDPILEYGHSAGRCSVTGGYRYQGSAEPRLRGVYLYADFCTGEIFGTIPKCPGATPQWESRVLYDAPYNVTAFGQDAAGELYVTQFAGGDPPPATSKLHLLALAPGSGGPDLVPSPEPIDFGTVEVGDTVSAQLTLTNANAGPEAAAVTAAVLSDSARFAVDPGGRQPPRATPPARACRPARAARSGSSSRPRRRVPSPRAWPTKATSRARSSSSRPTSSPAPATGSTSPSPPARSPPPRPTVPATPSPPAPASWSAAPASSRFAPAPASCSATASGSTPAAGSSPRSSEATPWIPTSEGARRTCSGSASSPSAQG